LPFAAIYTLVWAFLQSLGIFANVSSSVNRILAFIIAFLTIPFGLFAKFVWILFVFMGGWSVVIFAATFIVGIFFRGATVARKEYTEYKKLVDIKRERLKEAMKKIEALKDADLDTMKREIPPIITAYMDVLPTNVSSLLQQALQREKVEEAKSFIEQAVSQLSKQF
jgi:hypothetical protein